MKKAAWFRPSSWMLVLVLAALAVGPSACGSDEGSSTSGGDDPAAEVTSESGPAQSPSEAGSDQPVTQGAAFEDVLACLQAEGIEAEDQSNSTGGAVIGIDYSGGRTTIEFEESQEDADTTASIAESYGEVIQAGTVVASIDPSGSSDSATVASCIQG
jgi:hypothetical protein